MREDDRYYNYWIKWSLLYGFLCLIGSIGLIYRAIETCFTASQDDLFINMFVNAYVLGFALSFGIGFLLNACKCYYKRDGFFMADHELNLLQKIGKIRGIQIWVPIFVYAVNIIICAIVLWALQDKSEGVEFMFLRHGVVLLAVGVLVVILCKYLDKRKVKNASIK